MTVGSFGIKSSQKVPTAFGTTRFAFIAKLFAQAFKFFADNAGNAFGEAESLRF